MTTRLEDLMKSIDTNYNMDNISNAYQLLMARYDSIHYVVTINYLLRNNLNRNFNQKFISELINESAISGFKWYQGKQKREVSDTLNALQWEEIDNFIGGIGFSFDDIKHILNMNNKEDSLKGKQRFYIIQKKALTVKYSDNEIEQLLELIGKPNYCFV